MWQITQIFYFLKHILRIKTKLGFGVHSPYLFNIIKYLQKRTTDKNSIKEIESVRNKLLKNSTVINITDYGTGSKKTLPDGTRSVKSIAKHSLSAKYSAKLLFKLCKYLKPTNIIELGTSLGISAAYMAKASPDSEIITIDGCPEISKIASKTLKSLNIDNAQLITGNFDNILPELIDKQNELNIVFFDGNHAMEPTLRYFELLKQKAGNNSVFIFDDIYYSAEMFETWNTIKQDNDVTATLDFYYLGVVFFKKELSKQDLKIFY